MYVGLSVGCRWCCMIYARYVLGSTDREKWERDAQPGVKISAKSGRRADGREGGRGEM